MQSIFDAVEPDYIQGITLSGGDPLDQSDSALEQLSEFIRLFKERFPEKDIWIYSGGRFEDLIKRKPVSRILKQCDVLVDSPFKQELKDPDLAFRGSSNQRIINLKQ
jgi:anaerobic ribonucleoside-triphosphate reductase activating protein